MYIFVFLGRILLFNMKRFLLFSLLFIGFTCFSQQKKLPNASVKNLSGAAVSLSQFNKTDQPVIISFWATWCGPCINELSAIHNVYEKWQEELGVRLIAVSIDDARTKKRVKPLVSGKGWKYEVLLDENHDIKRALNVINVPYTMVVYKGEVIFEHSNYTPGSENEMYKVIKAKVKP